MGGVERKRIVIGVSGASGIILAHKAVSAVAQAGFCVDLVLSKASLLTAREELGSEFATSSNFLASFPQETQPFITLHPIGNFGATIASGSYRTKAMIVIPCSMSTLAAIALGLSDNLLRRAADVMLKERRPLVIVPRETPFSSIHLEHMLKLTQMGASIVAPIPAWYNRPKTIDDIENFIVGKCLDAIGIDHCLFPRWEGLS